MNPTDFIGLAIKLSNSSQEAELRTAVSRAYYGAFHSARGLLEECGIDFPPQELFGADIHRKVRFCLANAGNADAALVAGRLGSLRRQRNMADYDLKTDKFARPNRKNVGASLQTAKDVIDALDRCRDEPTCDQLRETVRAYARDVLRLLIKPD